MTGFHETPFRTAEEREAAASRPVHERQAMIERLLYKYPLFKAGEEFIRRFHFPFDNGTYGKGTIGGLLGPSRVGKSTICEFYASGIENPEPDEFGETYRVIHVTATSQTTPSSLTDTIAAKTGLRSIPAKLKTQARVNMVLRRLETVRTELIILDDAQFLFLERTRSQVQGFLSLLKDLADMKTLNVLLVGIDEVRTVVAGFDYIEGRGGFKHKVLAPLGDEGEEFNQFRLLLSKIDARLPFRQPSVLADSIAVAADVHAFTGGSIGRVMNLVREASALAMNANSSGIFLEHFRQASTLLGRVNDTRQYFRRS